MDSNVLGIYPRGWRVPLSFLHEGERIDTFVRLTGVHSPEELLARVQPNRQQRPAPMPDSEDPEKARGTDATQAGQTGFA